MHAERSQPRRSDIRLLPPRSQALRQITPESGISVCSVALSKKAGEMMQSLLQAAGLLPCRRSSDL